MPKKIKTFVFLNIGVTGLQECYGELSPVKIILKTISRAELLTGQFDNEDVDLFNFEPINGHEYVRGQSLTKYNLQFGEYVYEDFVSYLEALQQPLVLVAYGGTSFHFPILRNALPFILNFVRCVDFKDAIFELETGMKNEPPFRSWIQDLKSYKLSDVYTRVTGYKYAFNMEGRGVPLENLEKLTRTANGIAGEFIKWVDYNHTFLFQ